MPYLRWLHKSWNVIWTFVGVLTLTLALLVGVGFGLLQFQPVKNQAATILEQRFNKNFEGVIHIGRLEGLIPVELNMTDVTIYADSASVTPVLEAESINAGLDIWSLFRNRLVVNSLEVKKPSGIMDRDSEQSLEKAFRNIKKGEEGAAVDERSALKYEFIIPTVIIENGSLVIKNLNMLAKRSGIDSLNIQDVNLDMFVEFSDEQRFLDLNRLTFNAPQMDLNEVEIFGQLYNDDQFFELNAFNVKVGDSKIRFSGEANGVNILAGNVKEQLNNSRIDFTMDQISVSTRFLEYLLPDLPSMDSKLSGMISGEGGLDSLTIDNAELSLGDSYAKVNGYVTDLRKLENLRYMVDVEAIILGERELQSFENPFNTEQVQAIAASRLEGLFIGDRQTTQGGLNLFSNRGGAGFNGDFNWGENTNVNVSFFTDSLDLGYLFDPRIQSTDLTLNGNIQSSSLDLREGTGRLVIESGEGIMDGRKYEEISINAEWSKGIIKPAVDIIINGSPISMAGNIDLNSDIPEYQLNGSAGQVDVNNIIMDDRMRPVVADFEYDIKLKGTKLNELHGQLSLDVIQAIAGTDTLDRHQLYMDLNDPGEEQRILRLTTTAFDATARGDFDPADLLKLGSHWKSYFTDHIRNELLFDEDVSPQLEDTLQIDRNQDLTVSGRVKNVGLIKAYYPQFPSISSLARINTTLNLNSQRLLFNATLLDNRIQVEDFKADSIMLQVTGGFRYESQLKSFSGLQLQLNTAEFQHPLLKGKDLNLFSDLSQDRLKLEISVKELAEDASFNFEGDGDFSDEALTLNILDFELGSNNYKWVNGSTPQLKYRPDESLSLNDFTFNSDNQFIEVNGTYSTSQDDSVYYNIGNVDLGKVSGILGGRLSFGGILDGEFTSKTLTTVPTVQGDVAVQRFDLNGDLVGDVNLSSRYNTGLNRFDTNIIVRTDSSKYPEYYENNNRKGQQVDINGYVLAPRSGRFPETDSLYYFDVDFKNIDLWILPLIGPKIFKEGAGLADGSGSFWGNRDDYDFEADFMVGVEDAAYLGPRFLDTYYYAQGGLTFTRDEGLTFNDIFLIDPSGGQAILSGYYDFNDFAETQYMNISLDMDEFQFLNSTFDPTAAFYGKAYGSSVVTISGTNQNPILRTEEPVLISDFSEISIPLLEETEFDESNRFIRFVDSFELNKQNRQELPGNANRSDEEGEVLAQQLSFAERFTLDLQFVANNPMTVQLIFDPVTGDIVTTEGTGRIRILLEDEQVSMFGRFDIQGGRYQFVSGDIFTRRLELEPGGTIIWEGDPANARLNLNAIYSARPDVNSLSSNGARDPNNSQRVPVDLVLNIGGTISSIENDFYFRLPNTIETQQNSTLSTQLATINRDNDLKLIQAANFMLMGNFIPVSSTGEAQANLFGDNLSGSAAVLNPLLSSQVINPLLSNQVNSLLNSDLSSLDVDFNLNTYNQVDLGVALRLYNDKLILRREGQITGRQSNIGDLGATYRINRTFALTAFHRQDLTFGTVSSTEQSQQSQDINGLGLEAKVTFNTWDEFFNRLFSPFRKIFGKKDKEGDQTELTDNKEGRSPE